MLWLKNRVWTSCCAAIVLATCLGTPTTLASDWVAVSPTGEVTIGALVRPQAPVVPVYEQSYAGVNFGVQLRGLEFEHLDTLAGEFVAVTCPETPVDGDVGAPALPVCRRLICTPVGADVFVTVAADLFADVNLPRAGYAAPIAPMQGAASLDPTLTALVTTDQLDQTPLAGTMFPLPLLKSADAYTQDVLPTQPTITIKPVGIVRGWQLHQVDMHPVAYAPASGTLRIWPTFNINLEFVGGTRAPAHLAPTAGFNQVVLNPPRCIQPRGGAGNLLLIVSEDLAGSTPHNQLVSAKQAQGYNVTSYTVLTDFTIYTIQSYIEGLWGTANAPDFILILGDAIGTSYVATSNSIPAWTAYTPRATRTDLYFGCMDGTEDWIPEIAVGRLPARDVAALQAMVDKTLSVEDGPWADPTYSKRAALISDTDADAQGEEIQDHVISNYLLPANMTCQKLYPGTYGSDTQDISDAFNDGVILLSKFGHAAGFQAWGYPTYLFSDIEALTNTDLYPLVISFTCSGAAFHYTDANQSPGMCEKMVIEPGKGAAIAYGSAMSLLPYDWSSWRNLYRFFFRSIYQDDIRQIGPACQAAAAYLTAFYGVEDPVSRDYTEEFVVLGDPSLELPEPPPPNYLICTAELYYDSSALNQFIAHKQGLGFNVMTYTVASGTSNTDLKSYIQSLWGTSDAPDYVLLVGDTDGTSATSDCVPHFVGGGNHYGDTDWPYVCFDSGDDWYPEIPIGRFSVRTVSSLQDVVDKTIKVETGPFANQDYVKTGAFLANSSTYNTAEPSHDYVIENYLEPNGYTGIKIYASDNGTTQDAIDAINAGTLFVVYYGHSSQTGWWEPSFGSTEINSLINSGLYPLAMGWSCNTSQYTYDECFGETWLRAANKGAAAYISASDYIYWTSYDEWLPSMVHERSFFAALFEDNEWRLGNAWLNGLYRFLTEYGQWDGDPSHNPAFEAQICRNFFEEFVILGDPSLRLPQPDGFTLSADPDNAYACSPPDESAAFLLDIAAQGDFAEGVTLSTVDLPTGATAEFSANNELPPFTSILTVGNLTAVGAGEFVFSVEADGGSQQRSVDLTLRVSTALPNVPTLSTPTDGAYNVSRHPTLTWQSDATALVYDVEVAADPGFGDVVVSQTVSDASLVVTTLLDGYAEYYWRVRANNGCGATDFSTAFVFTTAGQTDYFTEQFVSGETLDIDNLSMVFTPDGSASFYDVCVEVASGLPVDPDGGTELTLGDDDSEEIVPTTGVDFYGMTYSSLHVNSNGNLTFNSGDGTYDESLDLHFNQTRISALFDDLNPSSAGTISWKETVDAVVVTYEEVPEYSSTGANTFQIELFFDGVIRITWFGLTCGDAIVGVSSGPGETPEDYIEYDISAAPDCGAVQAGACCHEDVCTMLTEADCLTTSGTYQGDSVSCEPNPCIEYDTNCLIISEVVLGTESGACPRWMEITNTGVSDFVFTAGGVIVQEDSSSDVLVDINLTGTVISAGQSFVINSNARGTCTGAFGAIYSIDADLSTEVEFGFGNERLILTDTDDGSNLIDIYGEFGVDGTGQSWEYTNGYSYRLPNTIHSVGVDFDPSEWHFGGVDSLTGSNPTQLLLDYTTPTVHAHNGACTPFELGDMDCSGSVNFDDIDPFVTALVGQEQYEAAYPDCYWVNADCNTDGSVNFDDIDPFVQLLVGS